jgi:methyl-accepting chemotaxis protein
MIHDISELLAEKDTKLRLYSKFPFPNRNSRALDAFQDEAWTFLSATPEQTFVRQETRGGVATVRVAIADRMVAHGCVDCHNTIVGSPKTDWSLGDVRGVLEVEAVIDEQLAAGAYLSNALIIVLVLAGVVLIAITVAGARMVAKPIVGMTGVMRALDDGDLDA